MYHVRVMLNKLHPPLFFSHAKYYFRADAAGELRNLPSSLLYSRMGTGAREGAMSQATLATTHVLIVDDDRDIRQTIAEILESEGYSVAVAANGQAALDRIAERRPALVLLDLQMPVMSGWEVLGHLRERGARIPVVFMTAGYRAQTEAERHHAEGHLGKPFEMDDLLHVVARFTGHTPPV